MNWRQILGLAVLAFAFFIDGNIESNPTVDYNAILDLKNEETKSIGLKEEVTEQIDRENIAIIHNEMGKRLLNYTDVNTLQFENFYIGSTKDFFGDSLIGKYRNLGEKIHSVILTTLGETEGQISPEEMTALSKRMRGLAWEILN